ncbi:MAG: hypothetical protein E7323_04330 [Clostridiales bacterium]|nr:hypothetical protein [Clostridiales bacterium]
MDLTANKEWILKQLNRKEFRSVEDRLEEIIDCFLTYDFHFMRLTGVLDENDEAGENEYDEDEAFEYIYDAYLADHVQDDDEDMVIASLLNRYMELQAEYL